MKNNLILFLAAVIIISFVLSACFSDSVENGRENAESAVSPVEEGNIPSEITTPGKDIQTTASPTKKPVVKDYSVTAAEIVLKNTGDVWVSDPNLYIDGFIIYHAVYSDTAVNYTTEDFSNIAVYKDGVKICDVVQFFVSNYQYRPPTEGDAFMGISNVARTCVSMCEPIYPFIGGEKGSYIITFQFKGQYYQSEIVHFDYYGDARKDHMFSADKGFFDGYYSNSRSTFRKLNDGTPIISGIEIKKSFLGSIPNHVYGEPIEKIGYMCIYYDLNGTRIYKEDFSEILLYKNGTKISDIKELNKYTLSSNLIEDFLFTSIVPGYSGLGYDDGGPGSYIVYFIFKGQAYQSDTFVWKQDGYGETIKTFGKIDAIPPGNGS